MGLTYRQPKQVYSVAQRIDFNTSGIGSGIKIGDMPEGALPIGVQIDIGIAFDNSAYVNLGFSSTGFEFAFDQSLTTVTTRQSQRYLETITTLPLSAAREVWVKVVNSPTVGRAMVRLDYLY